ncbi:MAG TPA: hypothetical protein VF723_16080 [Pyrinomonadaceae bacterium]|jgi:hypothetical protein
MKSKTSPELTKRTTRRRFAKEVGATLVAGPLAASLAKAQTPAKTRQAPAPPGPQPTPAQQQKPSPLAEAYAEVARARFGERLTPEQFEQVRKDLEGNVKTAERLRGFKLNNGDEPDFIFYA